MAGLWRRLVAGVLLALLMSGQAAAQTLLLVGDSISAGYGLEPGQGWADLFQMRLREQKPGWALVNASISGDTTSGGLARLPALLQRHAPQLVLIELGGNDGLRGQPPARMQANLQAMVRAARASGAQVVLLGMQLPPNYGPRYTRAFAAVYQAVADSEGTALVPFLLDGVGGVRELMQADGVHPNAAAQPRLLENVWPVVAPLL